MAQVRKIRIHSVSRVALVDDGANLMPALYKRAGDGGDSLEAVAEVRVDGGRLYGIVTAPYRIDAQGHFQDPPGIESACHSFACNGFALDLLHGKDVLDKEAAQVVENMILGGPDKRFPTYDHLGRDIPHEGAWAIVVQLNDERLRKLAAAGTISEFSLHADPGQWAFVEATAEDFALTKSRGSSAATLEHDHTDTEYEMKPEELQAILDATNKSMIQMLDEREERRAKAEEERRKAEQEALDKRRKEEEEAEKKRKEEEERNKTLSLDDLLSPEALSKRKLAAARNDIMRAFEIDPENPAAGINALSVEELEEFAAQNDRLNEEFGLTKGRDGKPGKRGAMLKRRGYVRGGDGEDDESISNEELFAHYSKAHSRDLGIEVEKKS